MITAFQTFFTTPRMRFHIVDLVRMSALFHCCIRLLSRGRSFRSYGGDFQFYLQIIAHVDAAGLKGSIPGQAELAAFDLGGGRCSNPYVSERILSFRSGALDLEND